MLSSSTSSLSSITKLPSTVALPSSIRFDHITFHFDEREQKRHSIGQVNVLNTKMAKSKERISVFTKKYEDEYSLKDVMDGDVFILRRDRKVQNAGVYSDGQIIQMKAGLLGTEVNKVNPDTFPEENNVTIYRKKGGIPRTFKENVDEAMSKRPETNYTYYNCMEFVMELLGIYLQPTASDCYKIGSGAKPKGFKVIKNFSDDYNNNAKLGDLFLVQSGILGYSLHAGVCYSEKGPEIIQLKGAVNRVHINGFSGDKKFAIYRKKTGVSSSIRKTMDKAWRSMPKYSESDKNKSVRFALELLCGELEETERDVEGLTQLLFGDL